MVGGQPLIAESMYGQGMYGPGPMYGPMYGYPKAEAPYPSGLREPAPIKFTEVSVLQMAWHAYSAFCSRYTCRFPCILGTVADKACCCLQGKLFIGGVDAHIITKDDLVQYCARW